MTAVPEKKSFPEANVDKELNPGHNKTVEADSTSSQIAANKAQAKVEAEKKKRLEKKDEEGGGDGLKTTVIMSVIFAAVAGAAFGIAKMLRERR
ncbi:hypothetical protein LINGRAHAP2_LOCUS13077 [Linum grandiflorum]